MLPVRDSVHLHLRSFRLGQISFIGFNGLPTHWGMSPIAEMIRQEVAEKHRDILDSQVRPPLARLKSKLRRTTIRVAKLAVQTASS